MKSYILSAFIAVIPVGSVGAQPAYSNDERAVRSVVQQVADTASGQSASAREALFADDAQIINAFGNRAQGRKEIDSFWESMFNTGMFRTAKNEEKVSACIFSLPSWRLSIVSTNFRASVGQRAAENCRLGTFT